MLLSQASFYINNRSQVIEAREQQVVDIRWKFQRLMSDVGGFEDIIHEKVKKAEKDIKKRLKAAGKRCIFLQSKIEK